MKEFMKKNKVFIIKLSTVILGIIFLIIANRVSTKGEKVFGKLSVAPVYKAEVSLILAENYDNSDVSSNQIIFFNALITSGEQKGTTVIGRQYISSLYQVQHDPVQVGDKIIIRYTEYGSEHKIWLFQLQDRSNVILALALVFVAFLLLFGRKQGVLTIISLLLTCGCVFLYFIPAIISGGNIYLATAVSCVFVVIVALVLISGLTYKSLAAALGCFGGLISAGLIFKISDHFLRLTGMVDEQTEYILMLENFIDLKAIIFSSILISVLGGVLDVGVSIASSLSEIYPEGSSHPFSTIVKSGMNIGRDVISTMTNTLMLVFIGGALSTAILMTVHSNSFAELINRESIIVEVLHSLIGSIGLMFTVPITTTVFALSTRRKSIAPSQTAAATDPEDLVERIAPLKARSSKEIRLEASQQTDETKP